jgi:hypothetical protein
MKSMFLKVLGYPRPLRVVIARAVVRRLSLFSYRERLEMCAIDRPHYGHCIFEAAQLAARLGYPKISVIEFGCGGGNGLINAEMHIAEVERLFPIDIELYGFDTGVGLPPLDDYRDFPHYFKSEQYHMDTDSLRQRLRKAKLVLGNVKDTCTTFFAEHRPAPIGCIFHDLDFYTSTADALTLFDADSQHFMPRVWMYFDDIIGNDNTWLPSEFTGELLAIDAFNKAHPSKKIAANRFMAMAYPDQWWRHQIYIYHDFMHPKYNTFVAAGEQDKHEAGIKLQA